MKVEIDPKVAEKMLIDPLFSEVVERSIKDYNMYYETKLVNYKSFGLLIHKESEGYLKVSICE